jgi:hypothetical protein
MKSNHLVFLALTASLLTACAFYVKPVDEEICTKCVGLIKDGKTTRSEVLQQEDFYLHAKTLKSHNNTILIFKFGVLEKGLEGYNEKGLGVYNLKFYDLVLVFDENDVLQKHSVVQIR